MRFLTENEIRFRTHARVEAENRSAEDILDDIAQADSQNVINNSDAKYDIFLSHTARDAEIVLGVYDFLVAQGFHVYCDWISDSNPSHAVVSPENAERVRVAMHASDTLLFVDSKGAEQSRWMCWEIGWFDGRKGLVAILPVVPEAASNYKGREFLGLYPLVQFGDDKGLIVVRPVVPDSSGLSIIEAPNSQRFEQWQAGDSFMRPRVARFWGRVNKGLDSYK